LLSPAFALIVPAFAFHEISRWAQTGRNARVGSRVAGREMQEEAFAAPDESVNFHPDANWALEK
jgi:phage terminase large subunit-like protein